MENKIFSLISLSHLSPARAGFPRTNGTGASLNIVAFKHFIIASFSHLIILALKKQKT
jgi:hypothetical protein